MPDDPRREPPMAMCTRCDDQPLVMTFERPKKEFVCVECGGWFEYLQPRPAPVTPERSEKLEAAKERYDAERKARADSANGEEPSDAR